MRRGRTWTGLELQWMRTHFLQYTDPQLAERFGTTTMSVQGFRLRNGLVRPKTNILEHRYNNTDALRAYNTARKGRPYKKHFRHADRKMKVKWYIIHRFADGTYQDMTLAKHVWVSAGRPVPKGHFVVQLSGNPRRPKLDELVCVDRRGLGRIGGTSVEADRTAARQKGEERRRARLIAKVYKEHKPYEFQRIANPTNV